MGKIILKTFSLLLVLQLGLISCINQNVNLSSADGNYHFKLNTDMVSGLTYSIDWNKQPIITKSALGFQFKDSINFPVGAKIISIENNSVDTTWIPVYGEQSSYLDKYNEVLVKFSTTNAIVKNFSLRVRAYNEGVAFRYEFNQKDPLNISSELTEYAFDKEPIVWVSKATQSPIKKIKLSELKGSCERPLLAEMSKSLFVALGEAALVDFAAMKFVKTEGSSNKLQTQLQTTSFKKTYAIQIPAGGFATPWRYIMAGESPSAILQNNFLLLNLNEPNKIKNTSWIEPGKVIRETTLTTIGAKATIDFATKHNLKYIEFDGGWYGNPWDDSSDSRTVSVDPRRSPGPLDLEEVVKYGKQNGIGVILYVDRREIEKKLDELLPLYKSWGVVGIKFGFVQVGPQYWTKWLYEAVKKTSDYGFMIDVHDNYRPTGYSRTYPNLVTQEGIRGDEEATPNELVINSIYTRMIAGAADQTNCYFNERILEMGSHASQMAKSICIYSPWQFIYWYDRPEGVSTKIGGAGNSKGIIREIPDLEFYDKIPTVWDQTKVIDGYPGEFVIIARKKSDVWYLGALTGTVEKEINVKLDFLDKEKIYNATIYSDDSTLDTETKVKIETIEVTQDSNLQRRIMTKNGLAVIFTPIVE